jgi:hypothetical protein
MPQTDPILLFLTRLNRLEIKYMVSGSVASITYGEPRLTHDIDIVVELDHRQVGFIPVAFPAPDFYCPPVEVIRLESDRPCNGHSRKKTLRTRNELVSEHVGHERTHRGRAATPCGTTVWSSAMSISVAGKCLRCAGFQGGMRNLTARACP